MSIVCDKFVCQVLQVSVCVALCSLYSRVLLRSTVSSRSLARWRVSGLP